MKTLLKSAFILAFMATVTSCDFFGKGPDNTSVVEKPATEIHEDSAGENKTEEKKEIDSVSVQNDSLTESKEKKEAK